MLEFISVSNTRLGLATCAFSLALAVAANPVVQIIAPGLSQQHHVAAVIMLRIMSPVLILSGASLLILLATCSAELGLINLI